MKPLVNQRYLVGTLVLFCIFSGYSAFAQDESGIAMRGVVIPTGFQAGKYSAMIQVAVDGSSVPDATWELDAIFASRRGTPQEFSSRVTAAGPDTPVAFEVQLEFEPGDTSLTLEASGADKRGRHKVLVHWPDPDSERGTVSPIALLQPSQGAFMRGESLQSRGALACGADNSIQSQLPTAVISVVCRGPGVRDTVRIDRKLAGAASVDFQTIELLPEHDRCAQVRDIIPPGALGTGTFNYEVHLTTDTGRLASGTRQFLAAAGGR